MGTKSNPSHYTKGEWKVKRQRIISVDNGNEIIATTKSPPLMPTGQAEANAHLIAAAPDMYEALKVARNEIERLAMVTGYEGEAHFPKLEQINEALAKAEDK